MLDFNSCHRDCELSCGFYAMAIAIVFRAAIRQSGIWRPGMRRPGPWRHFEAGTPWPDPIGQIVDRRNLRPCRWILGAVQRLHGSAAVRAVVIVEGQERGRQPQLSKRLGGTSMRPRPLYV